MKIKFPIKLVIKGNPITKKNHSNIYVNKKTGRPFVSPSSQYKEYLKLFILQCVGYRNINLNQPLNIKCEYYMETKRMVDLTNLLSSTMDCLVSAGVIEDDNCNIAVSNDGSRVYYDKNNPRVEIEISESERTFVC